MLHSLRAHKLLPRPQASKALAGNLGHKHADVAAVQASTPSFRADGRLADSGQELPANVSKSTCALTEIRADWTRHDRCSGMKAIYIGGSALAYSAILRI
eukprot:1150986-Pelagomonas_calceolata.AAC.3